MKVVNVLGGLGNQMFQYALAVALKQRFPESDVKIDPSGFRGYLLHNGYELKRIFNVEIPEASAADQTKLFYPLRNYRMWQVGRRFLPKRKSTVYENEDMAFMPSVLSDDASKYYLGYWQTEKYFADCRDAILKAFEFPPLEPGSKNYEVSEQLKGKNVVSVHVRRGDYLTLSNTQNICNLDYYKKAISQILQKTTPDAYLVFSDGIDWCKENLSDSFGDVPVIFVDWNKGEDSFRDMQLMSLCSHNIIANSSFSWWGAWLNNNPDKIVIAPSRWMNSGGWVDIIPDSWEIVH